MWIKIIFSVVILYHFDSLSYSVWDTSLCGEGSYCLLPLPTYGSLIEISEYAFASTECNFLN